MSKDEIDEIHVPIVHELLQTVFKHQLIRLIQDKFDPN